jgi:hypothetical protein
MKMAAVFSEARCRPNLDNHHWSTYLIAQGSPCAMSHGANREFSEH